MFHRTIFSLTLAAAILHGQDSTSTSPSGPRLTAREIFYGAQAPEPVSTAKPATPAKKTQTVAKGTTPAKKAPPKTKSVAEDAIRDEVTPVVLAANHETTGSPAGLAMRWSIVQNFPGGVKKEVPTTTEFKSGDAINVRVEVNDYGYLYIFARGSSGNWTPLFPSPSVENGDNRVGPNHPYLLPNGYVFRFDDKPGTERIFVVFSRKPEADFDTLLYKVAPDRSEPVGPAPGEDKPAKKPHPGIILAQNSQIGDPFVDRMKQMYARDLIVERAEGAVVSSLGPRFEYAAYVATPRKEDPRVVAEVTLVHK
jgi:hypothetical protein